ncbi:Glyoxylase, beta-lactamase superfamily II [Geodermatophilus telluris]|uniref:Metallo-beta-lactamase domain-containing protein 1 n=1 Tax=Geodermatophilus telluris TaxID=1190417 RepID=A0A1G6QLZ8_9ACTN|nr:MBL fold metallo-hydrolase [Geodermatophilus telluris]SDC92707.1 Glyoxylase, beta-lactamase superfamily II [Geodermatophilus telluris]
MTPDSAPPPASSAAVHVLTHGYADMSPTPWSVASTVTYIRDGDTHVIVDPGLVSGPNSILDPLRELGVRPEDITDIIFSHHHPDHTVNAALFPQARMHDHMAIYRNDTWLSRPAEGFEISSSIRLLETPGHTPQDITTLVETAEDTVALSHLWWFQAGPPEDPLATDGAALRAGRERVLDLATLIIPGHGAPFVPDASTPR